MSRPADYCRRADRFTQGEADRDRGSTSVAAALEDAAPIAARPRRLCVTTCRAGGDRLDRLEVLRRCGSDLRLCGRDRSESRPAATARQSGKNNESSILASLREKTIRL